MCKCIYRVCQQDNKHDFARACFDDLCTQDGAVYTRTEGFLSHWEKSGNEFDDRVIGSQGNLY